MIDLLPGGSGQSPSYLVQLRQLANMIRETVDQEEIGKRTLRIVGDALPAASANILLRKFPGGPFYVAASQGHCQKQESTFSPNPGTASISFYPKKPLTFLMAYAVLLESLFAPVSNCSGSCTSSVGGERSLKTRLIS